MTITDWIPGIERDEVLGCTGPGITQFGAWSITFHTLEGSIATALRLFHERPCYCPHLTIAPKSRRAVQHIPLSWPAAALNNDGGGVETNRAREIQIEIEGFAAESHTWSDDDLEFIGWVLAKVAECVPGINLDHHPRFVGVEAGYIARKNAPQRMSPADWYAFDGVCGHQHVPENDHWDPGRLDIDTVVRHAKAHLRQPTDPGDDDVTTLAEVQLELTNQDTRTRAALIGIRNEIVQAQIDVANGIVNHLHATVDGAETRLTKLIALADSGAAGADVELRAGLTELLAELGTVKRQTVEDLAPNVVAMLAEPTDGAAA